MENNWYLYRHLKPNGEVFYIGIGKTRNFKRAYEKGNHNNYWYNTINKYGYLVEVLKRKLTLDEACELEKILISWYGRMDLGTGKLVNLTSGGQGTNGHVQSEESKKRRSDKISAIYKGEGNPFYGKDHTDYTKEYIGAIQLEFFTYLKGDENKVSKSTPRKSARPTINIVTNLEFKSLRESSEYYGVPKSTMKSRMLGNKMFKGNIWYKDVYESMSESVPPIISFLEQGLVLKENIKNN